MPLSFPKAAKAVVVAGAAMLVTPVGAGAATAATPAAPCPADAARPAADAYLDALTSHDASAVPFAPNVLRREDGLVTGRSADEIRQDLNTSWKYKIISGLRSRSYAQSGPTSDGTTTVNVQYLLDNGTPAVTLLTVHVQERFDVRCGQILYINAIITP
jgi:hypothetical protein